MAILKLVIIRQIDAVPELHLRTCHWGHVGRSMLVNSRDHPYHSAQQAE